MFRRSVTTIARLVEDAGRFTAASSLLAGTAASVLVGSSPPAKAQIYHWNFSGFFSSNAGPAQSGTFTGFFNWDRTGGGTSRPLSPIVPLTSYSNPLSQLTIANGFASNYVAGNGNGGFTYWDFKLFNSSGQFIQRIHSHNLTPSNVNPSPNEQDSPMSNTINPDSGCFGSPLEKGNAATGTYWESDVGGQVCTGSPTYNSGTSGAQLYFGAVQDEDFFYAPAGTGVTFTHSYFRIPLTATVNSGIVDGSTFQLLGGINPQSDEWYGWSLYTFGITESPTEAAVSAACKGANTAIPSGTPPPPPCPYSGNNQPRQGITGSGFILQQNEIPAPLPLAGAVPLGAALRRLSGRRRKLLASASSSGLRLTS